MRLFSLASALLVLSCAASPPPSTAAPPQPAEPSAEASERPASTPAVAADPGKPTPCKTADRISGRDAEALVRSGATLVDVRSPEEFGEGHVEGARNIPVGDIETRLSEIPKDHPVVVYCKSGMRASRAAAALRSAGFTAYNMGGVGAWGRTDC